MTKSTHLLTTALLLTSSLFAAQAMAKTVNPQTAIQAMRDAMDAKIAKQANDIKEISGLTDDKQPCTVDVMGVDALSPSYNDVSNISLKVGPIVDDEPTAENVFMLGADDQVKEFDSKASPLVIQAKVQHEQIIPHEYFGPSIETKTVNESISIEMSQDRITAITIVNDKDKLRCNFN